MRRKEGIDPQKCIIFIIVIAVLKEIAFDSEKIKLA